MSEPGAQSPLLRLDSTDPPSETPPSETPPSAASIDFSQLTWSEPTVQLVGKSAQPVEQLPDQSPPQPQEQPKEQRQIETSVAEAELMLGGQSYQAQITRTEGRTNGALQQSEIKIALQQDGRNSITGTAAVLFARARRSKGSQSSTIEVYLQPADAQPAMDIDNAVATELYAMLLKSLPYQLQRGPQESIQAIRHVVRLDGRNGIPDDQLEILLGQRGYQQQEQHGQTSYVADSRIIQSI